jgi:uncharacterized membrane protein YfcA
LGVTVGFAFGAMGGARVAIRVAGGRLKQVFAGLMLLFALLVVLRGH